jgi:hypothetical protein
MCICTYVRTVVGGINVEIRRAKLLGHDGNGRVVAQRTAQFTVTHTSPFPLKETAHYTTALSTRQISWNILCIVRRQRGKEVEVLPF